MHVIASADELGQVEARLGLGVALPDAQDIEEGLRARFLRQSGSPAVALPSVRSAGLNSTYAIRAQLELHVYIAVVFKAVLERNDVGVRHGLVNLDLGKELSCERVSLRFRPTTPRLERRSATHLGLGLGRLELLLIDDLERLVGDAIRLGAQVDPREATLQRTPSAGQSDADAIIVHSEAERTSPSS